MMAREGRWRRRGESMESAFFPRSGEGMTMAWGLLLAAGLLETGWAIGLKYTDGFTRLLPSGLTGLAIAASMVMLSMAARSIPIGTAYAVWTGIGAAGAAILGILLFDEAASPSRLLFLSLLIASVIGLKATA
jgi:quaternary ammonium compound-resistance protein SugE